MALRAGVIAALASVLALAMASSVSALNDTDILNFALNLECLEAQFYSWAAHGHGLTAADRGNGPRPIGGKKAKLSPAAQQYAAAIAFDELRHVRFLRTALGKDAVACPLLDIGAAFSDAADAATGVTLTPPFSPYSSDTLFYLGSYIFEDVGVTAYHGAAPLLTSKTNLLYAAGILGTEAYHAGSIRTLLYSMASQHIFPYTATVGGVTDAISKLRAAVSRAADDVGVVNPNNGKLVLVPSDKYGITFARTTQQVLNIVYLGGKGQGSGGFFPNGLNGSIK